MTKSTSASANPKWKPKIKHILWILAVVLVLFFVIFSIVSSKGKKAESPTQLTATVNRGDIVKTIEGTGTIEAIDQYTISALATGEIMSDTFEEGDMVKKGDLLYTIDSTNLNYNIEKAESSVASARISYNESMQSVADQTVTAPINGTITALYVKDGDEINAGAKIADIVNSDTMLLTVPFLASDAQQLLIGATATVVPTNSPSSLLHGSVKSIASGTTVGSTGAIVSTVEIAVTNPGGITKDATATATVQGFACNAPGTFDYAETRFLTANVGGTVNNLSVHNGDHVSTGNVLCYLSSDTITNNAERSRISLNDAQRSLNNTRDQMKDYQITAPIDGKIIQKNVKAGDKLDSGANSKASSMAIIADLSTLTFSMNVDELDIANVSEGQDVTITADAFPEQTFHGHVDNVSIVGTSSNGVTSYPVKVVLDGNENSGLIPGMNVSATIITESRTDILTIPISAIKRGNWVLVQDGGSENTVSAPSASGAVKMPEDAPTGYHYVYIETGISDSNYMEVTNGLREGDTLLLPDISGEGKVEMTDASEAAMMNNMDAMRMHNAATGGMPGGAPGGAPGGMR
ncbi:MAG: HlyD family efflux transporter periplasmic adaptor subunit [Clostridia bacterium]|nr:HlyD family efflux transporter periplasmic adaptor subunit [Clostridia bacterium]